jgi:hypothetical protein
MRVEYSFSLNRVEIPCFSVETTEGPHKLFTLTTLVLNVLANRDRADIIFHSPNQADLPKKISAFKTILQSGPAAPTVEFEEGQSGSLGSSYYIWLSIRSSGGPA